jgi:hypothetical protein
MSESQTEIEGWAIVELFGHNKIAGYVTTAIIGTSGMLRVDVPEVEGLAAFTRFYGPGAIYSLTLVTEEVARAALQEIRPRAVTVYIPRQIAASSAPCEEDEEPEDDEDMPF